MLSVIPEVALLKTSYINLNRLPVIMNNQQTTLGTVSKEKIWIKCNGTRMIDNAECGPTPPGEIVLRCAGCILSCIPCFAFAYSWPSKFKTHKDVKLVSITEISQDFRHFLNNNKPIKENSFNWFRIIGGEPFLTEKNLDLIITFIQNIDEKYFKLFNNRILIQTNGVLLGSLKKEDLLNKFSCLKDKRLKIVIEVSIKGSNPVEYQILTQSTEENYKKSIFATKNLEFVHQNISNIDWVAVAGFGIGVTNLIDGNLNKRKYIKTFYHPGTNKPFYHPDNWDELFKDVFSKVCQKYYNKFCGKFPMFGIEDRMKWKSCLHGLRNAKKFGEKYFYDIFTGSVINKELEKNFKGIFDNFFYGDPSFYYVKIFE